MLSFHLLELEKLYNFFKAQNEFNLKVINKNNTIFTESSTYQLEKIKK